MNTKNLTAIKKQSLQALKQQVTRNQLHPKTRWEKFYISVAYAISRILGPLPLLVLLWIVTAVRSGIGFWKALWTYPLILLIGLAFPTVILTYFIIRLHIDLDWSKLNQRIKALIIYLPFWAVALILIRQLTSSTIYHLAQLGTVLIITLIGITTIFKFKISLHTAAASAVFWGINFLTHFQYPWLFLLLIPIIWARYVLKIHTAIELFSGLILANSLIILAVLLFGLPSVPY